MVAIGVLWQSQKQGHHEEKQKFSLVCKVQSLQTNFQNASLCGAMNNIVLWLAKARLDATMAPSDSGWLAHKVYGRVSRKSRRVTKAGCCHLASFLRYSRYRHWSRRSGKRQQSKEISQRCKPWQKRWVHSSCIARYCRSFRGFELPNILLMELKDHILQEDSRDEVAHMGGTVERLVQGEGQCKGR